LDFGFFSSFFFSSATTTLGTIGGLLYLLEGFTMLEVEVPAAPSTAEGGRLTGGGVVTYFLLARGTISLTYNLNKVDIFNLR
jgi:hypothetical protein